MIGFDALAAVSTVDELRADEIRLLMSLGLHAAFNGHGAEALRLFDALHVLRPQRTFPRVGSAIALLADGHAEDAVYLLEAALAAHPGDDTVRSMLGFALRSAHREAQVRVVLQPLLAEGRDADAASLARGLLAEPANIA